MTTSVVETAILAEIVEKDLREQASVDERKILENHPSEWIAILKDLKRKTEQQFTKSKQQTAEAWSAWQEALIEDVVSDAKLDELKSAWVAESLRNLTWRTKANFFLYKIEGRLAYAKALK